MTSLGHQHHVLVICLARSRNCICIHLPWLCSLGQGILARQSQRSQIDFEHFCQSVPDVMFTKNSQIGFGHIYQSVALGTSTSLWLWALLSVCGFGHFYQSVPDVMFTSESRWQFLKLEVSYCDKLAHTPPSHTPPPHTPPPTTHSKKYTHHQPATKEHRPINQHNKQTASPVKLPVLIGICSLAVGSWQAAWLLGGDWQHPESVRRRAEVQPNQRAHQLKECLKHHYDSWST